MSPRAVAKTRTNAIKRIAHIEAARIANPRKPAPRFLLAMTNPYNVQPGQVWDNIDPRAKKGIKKAGPAHVHVYRVEPPYAVCYWVGEDGRVDLAGSLKSSLIRLDNFRPKEPRATRRTGGSVGWRLREPREEP